MRNRMPYRTPEDYFESLNERLLNIPAREGRPNWWTAHRGTAAPAFAIATSLLALVMIGGAYFRTTPSAQPLSEEEEIVEYLINSGTSVYLLSENI